ncbi:MAG: hypothetical protein MI919_29160 [Holophagales bacterium]|nr:hypothetical protein [Holophagales bacterium]
MKNRTAASLVFLALALWLAPAAAHGQPPEKLVDPEQYGSKLCKNAVRNSVAGCNTYGLNRDDVIASFPIDQLEVCRAECDECCDTLGQYGDGAAFAIGMSELCGCALGLSNPFAALSCFVRTLENRPGLGSTLLLYGLIDGNGIELPNPEIHVPVGRSRDGDMEAMWMGSGTVGERPYKGLNINWTNVLSIVGLLQICQEYSDDYGAALIAQCSDDCKNTFPNRSEIEMPPAGPENPGGNNGGGPENGPGGPEPPCAAMEGSPCETWDGRRGSLDPFCNCELDPFGPDGGDGGGTVEVDDGCGNLPWDVPEDLCQDWIESECWLCNNDQDPPAWCDERCW